MKIGEIGVFHVSYCEVKILRGLKHLRPHKVGAYVIHISSKIVNFVFFVQNAKFYDFVHNEFVQSLPVSS